MSKYKDNFDKLANSIYTKLMEATQQDPALQAQPAQPAQQQAVAAVPQPQDGPAAGAAMPVETGVVTAEPTQATGVEPGAESTEAQAGDEVAETGETDEVGMSEIQEMAGQLSQMIRDFKESNPDEFVEAAKFAAGMVVSAAISGLKYRDRKDILKKIKAGEFDKGEGEESGAEEQPAEQQPEGQEGMVSERLRKGDSRKDDEKRKGLNPIEKRKKKSPKSPFSGMNEAELNYNPNKNNISDIDNAKSGAQNAGESELQVKNAAGGENSNVILQADSSSDAASKIKDGYSAKLNIPESVRLTKRQLDMVRLSETKTKFVKFSKKQLDEIMKK